MCNDRSFYELDSLKCTSCSHRRFPSRGSDGGACWYMIIHIPSSPELRPVEGVAPLTPQLIKRQLIEREA